MPTGQVYSLQTTNKPFLQYIGSTTCSLEKRLTLHKCDYKRHLKGKYSYVSSFQIIKTGNYQIKLLEKVNYKNKDELRERENYWFENEICVNIRYPKRCNKQYRRDHSIRRNKMRRQQYKLKREEEEKVKFLGKYKFKRSLICN